MAGWSDATSFARAWETSVSERPASTFLIFEDEAGIVTEWTYAEFDRVVARTANFLHRNGVTSGSSVHLALTNCPTFIAVWIAAVRMGAWIVPSDPMGREPEFADHLARTGPTVGFCARDRRDAYVGAAPAVMTVVDIDESDAALDLFGPDSFVEEVGPWPEPAPVDRAAVMFTSGTTGRPKGVEITQANFAFVGMTMADAAALTAEDRQLVVLPLFHANAQYYSFASAIWVGASVALMHTFSASGFLGQAARHRATCASLFAAPIRMILARGEVTPDVNLRHCWFAQNIADHQYETISQWFGCRPRQLYGMTETIAAVLTDRADDPRPDTMGFVTSGCEVEVHGGDGRPVGPGVVGEVVVRGDRGTTLFAGYLDDPETTEASFRNGWFLTGDRATTDTDGRFYFDGRRSDVLKVAGENVSTVEVEAVLTAHEEVLEASVVGAPDPVRDEVPVAFVVAADTARPPDVDELLAWCEARLGKAKRPRDITLMSELPRTSVGKIRKFLLKEEARP